MCLFSGQQVAHPNFQFWLLGFHPPVCRRDQPQAGGGLGEHCSSPAVGRAPHKVELRSPACLGLVEGTPQGRQTGGDFFWLLFLARQEK